MEHSEFAPKPASAEQFSEKQERLREAVAERFGENAQFDYASSRGVIRVTFDYALQTSGHHFEDMPADFIIDMLEPMYVKNPEA